MITTSALVKAGIQDVEAARARLAEIVEYGGTDAPGDDVKELLAPIGRTADPDHTLLGLSRMLESLHEHGGAEAAAELLVQLRTDEGTAMRVLCVLGASEALTDHLVRHPDQWRELRDPELGSTRPACWAIRAGMLRAVGADPDSPAPVSTLPDAEALDALRVEYRRRLTLLAARDLTHDQPMGDTAGELSDLAAGTLEAALAVARTRVGEDAAAVRIAVIAMGKCGGHELNYVSDVDVLYVHEPVEGVEEQTALRAATQLASQLMQVCSDQTAEGTIWPVDANLRPEGRTGPLSRTLASHQAYYEKWAKTWEFQALLKARPVAGDLALGIEWTDMAAEFVWTAAERDGFVPEVQAMRRRVLEHIPAKEAARQLKLGSGGLRDVEFAVQLMQLVHGRADTRLRVSSTLGALARLIDGGYVGREDGEALRQAYAFLRTLEHRIQLFQLRRTHVVPEDEESLRRLGRSLGYLKEPIASLESRWRHHRREVRRLHEKLFYRPLLEAVARIPGAEIRLSPQAAELRMAALGYADPRTALRHLEALSTGVSRTATIQRTLLPVMLEWFADTPDPDAGLWGFRRISESLGRTPWYLKTLRDEGEVAQRLAQLLGTSRYATDLLEREPRGVQLLGDDLTPLKARSLATEMLSTAARHERPDDAVRAIRGVRRRELFRIAAGDLFGINDVEQVGKGLSRLTDATLGATLSLAVRAVATQRGMTDPPTRMAIIAMGRYGGFELSYGSDADVMFVHDPIPGADPHVATRFATSVVNELRRLLALPATDPPLVVDPDLRPEGKQGPLVRTLDSYAAYYAKWSQTWEFQALLRADAVVGDEGLRTRFTELIDPLRFPAEGISEDEVIEIRRIKARVEDERLPRGADPNTHLKLGRGGLADVEWTVQLLQMQYAGRVPTLRTTGTLEALRAATEAGLVDDEDAEELAEAWRMVSRVRNAATLVRGRSTDRLPSGIMERSALAQVLGYSVGESDMLVNDYLRVTRRAHAVVERVFWGDA